MNTEPSPPGVPEARTNKLALTSFVLGILSVLSCGVGIIFSIPGLICGFLGMSRVKNSGGTEKGHGMALTGTIMCGVSLIMLPVIGLLAAIAIPNFVKARESAQKNANFVKPREAAQKNACVANLRQIQTAKNQWALENKKTTSETPTETDLYGPQKYIRGEPACPAGGAYSINSVEEMPACTARGHAIY
jgi:hypothetical protein